MIPGLLLAYCGLSTLCFSLERSGGDQWQFAWCKSPFALRCLGWSLIGISFVLCLVRAQGAGAVTWCGFASLSGVLLAGLRPCAPRALGMLTIAAAVGAMISIAGEF